MDVVVVVTVMHVLLFVLHMSMLIECDGNAGVWDGGGLAAVSAACECMGGTRGSCIVSSADDMLECGAWCERCKWSV